MESNIRLLSMLILIFILPLWLSHQSVRIAKWLRYYFRWICFYGKYYEIFHYLPRFRLRLESNGGGVATSAVFNTMKCKIWSKLPCTRRKSLLYDSILYRTLWNSVKIQYDFAPVSRTTNNIVLILGFIINITIHPNPHLVCAFNPPV